MSTIKKKVHILVSFKYIIFWWDDIVFWFITRI